MSGYGKYCWIDSNNKTANCGDRYKNIQTTCKPVKDNVNTFYDNSHTASAKLTNQTLAVARDTNIDYNYFRASRMCTCPSGKCVCK